MTEGDESGRVADALAAPNAISLKHGRVWPNMAAAALYAASAGIALVAFTKPAAAQDINNVKSVDIAVQGHITQRCAMGSNVMTDLGDLRRQRITAAAQLQLDCNVPFTMSIKAQNGAIQHSTLPNGQGGYAGSVPYSLDVELPIRRPDRELISKVFEGRNLVGGQAISSSGGIALDGLLLRLSLGSVTSQAGLLAGEYGEVIEITVAPN